MTSTYKAIFNFITASHELFCLLDPRHEKLYIYKQEYSSLKGVKWLSWQILTVMEAVCNCTFQATLSESNLHT